MKHIVRKAYGIYEKEEKWLNEMSSKGLALTDYSWCRYVFEEIPNSEYTYRIELLENMPSQLESRSYLKFLEENGVECVATYFRWAYLRKRTTEGPFDLYTDIDSKIAHYKRINLLWSVLMYINLVTGIVNLVVGIVGLRTHDSSANIWMGCFSVLAGALAFLLGVPIRKKLKKLKHEKRIRE